MNATAEITRWLPCADRPGRAEKFLVAASDLGPAMMFPSYFEHIAVVLLAGTTVLLATLLMVLIVGRTRLKRAEKELRESEERWRTVAENVPDFVILIDQRYRLVFLNRYRPGFDAKQVIGSDALNYIDEEYWPAFVKCLEQVFQRGEPASLEALGRGGPDDRRWYITRMAPILKDGNVVYALLVATDITERKKAEEQLLQAQKMESIGLLAGGVAHDFNNMLTAINGNCSLLLRNMPTDHAWREIIKDVLHAGERAAELTRQLLAFSRKQMLQPRRLDLNQIVTDVEKVLLRTIGDGIVLKTELQPGLGPVQADPNQMEQVIFNLVLNARDAMPRGGTLTLTTADAELGEAEVQGHPEVRPGPYRRLTVIDTGQGMEDTVRAHIFEPFFTTKELGKGTGMGLAAVWGIVRQSGGHIVVDSAPGKGTTFAIYLPASGSAVLPSAPLPNEPDLARGTETILLVEDQESVRGTLRRVLSLCGYTLLEARHGMEAAAVSAGYQGPLHLLITDILMPQQSGPDLATQLRRQRPGLKVLFISGYPGDSAEVQFGLDQGEPFLQKPFTPSALADKVREVLDRKPT